MMQVNTYSPNFMSRNPSVRTADRICRMVKTEFPSISTSMVGMKVKNDTKYSKFHKLDFNLGHAIWKRVRDKVAPIKSDVIARYKKLAELVKAERLANCDELTRLAALICAANGIKSQPLHVKHGPVDTLNPDSCGHVALAVFPEGEMRIGARMSDMKDAIIIDPWLDLADYAPNVAQEYKNQYPHFLNIKNDDEVFMTPDRFGFILQEKDFDEVKKEFPELVFKENS